MQRWHFQSHITTLNLSPVPGRAQGKLISLAQMFARLSPAELAILLWHDAVKERLVSDYTGWPFTSWRWSDFCWKCGRPSTSEGIASNYSGNVSRGAYRLRLDWKASPNPAICCCNVRPPPPRHDLNLCRYLPNNDLKGRIVISTTLLLCLLTSGLRHPLQGVSSSSSMICNARYTMSKTTPWR